MLGFTRVIAVLGFTEMDVYIYALVDPTTKHIRYVGKTISPQNRLKAHIKNTDGKNTHRNAWVNKLARDGLTPEMEIIEEIKNSNDLDWQHREVFWIDWFKGEGYNLTNLESGGIGGKRMSDETREKLANRTFSESHREKLSNALKGIIPSPQCMAASRKAATGRIPTPESLAKRAESLKKTYAERPRAPMSDETKQKISKTLTGKPLPDETKQKLRAAWQRPGYRQMMSDKHTGFKPTAESIEKRASKMRGIPKSPEWCEMMSKKMKGRIISEETKKKMAASRVGRKLSEETKRNMSISQRARREKYLLENGVPLKMPSRWDKKPV
jgi:group I intron endonuclease